MSCRKVTYYSSGGCGGTWQWTSSNSCQLQPKTCQLQPTQPSSSSTPTTDASKFAEEMLKRHNELRAKHQAPPLKLNDQISQVSMNWARNIAARNCLSHSNDRRYGENCAYLYEFSAKKVVDMWYNEIQHYTYGTNYFNSATGHFTQVVWKDSNELGVGWAQASNGAIFVVANYSPPGNFQGRFVQNVLPPTN